MKRILVTGAAGFIGYHLCENLLTRGYHVVGIDNINDYYDVNLKYSRLKELGIDKEKAFEFKNCALSSKHGEHFCFLRMNLEDRVELPKLFEKFSFNFVINLAAQAGVRYSLEKPMVYVDSNIVGFVNILECCRKNNVKEFLYASSSSVYGNSDDVPFSTEQRVDNPISLYAATKRCNELMAFTYSHLYGIQTIGLRLFTVYGPWGRPDMAIFLFTDAILNDRPINVYNEGNLSRDFTYIDDIVDGIILIVENISIDEEDQIFNIGNSQPIQLLQIIEEIESITGKKARKIMQSMQLGDVKQTWADVEKLKNRYNYKPNYSVKEGVKNFVDWYTMYYK